MNGNAMRMLCAAFGLTFAGCGAVSHTGALVRGDKKAAPSGTYVVAGLRQAVEVVEDRWGVPHLYANSVEDVFLAQGFQAARERLFQIDLWRRRGLGVLSEVFGASYVEQDAAARLFLYRGDMRREWESYGPDARMAATQFAAGVNAYVDWLAQHPDALPEEFRLVGYTPSHWQPEDVVRIRSHGLTRNVASEVARSKVACAAGVEADRVRMHLEPEWHTTVPAGFDPCTLPPDVLRVFELATQPVAFDRAARKPVVPGALAMADANAELEGSNNWTIAPGRSATGRPILANDPHRKYTMPSQRYIAHLSAPGLDAIGAGEASQPGLSIGHNGTIAFGLTVFYVDQEDLYVYELDPNDHGRYRYGQGWEPLRTVKERVSVAGEPPRDIELRFTRHGPVVKIDEARHRAYVVRTAWQEPGMSPYYGNLRLLRARTFAEFKGAIRTWGAPTENLVYADVHGNIGWAPGGLVPKRRGYDGLLPVPGDGRYEWDGFYTGDDFPSAYNPPEGFIATANQMDLPADYPYQEKKLGFEWVNPARYQRIRNVLSASPHVSIDDSIRLQGDQLSLPALRIIALLPRAGAASAMLHAWDGVESADSAPAALFEVWRKHHLGPAFVKAVLPPAAARAVAQPDLATLLDALEHPQKWFGDDAVAKRDRLLSDTLDAAYADTSQLLGPQSGEWKWGRLLHSSFQHPLSTRVDDATRARLNAGPLPRGGSEFTVNASTYDKDFTHTAGASFRMVLDVGNWDASRAINTPGQSGLPDAAHYRDLAESWSAGATFPLLYSRPAVERNAARRIVLTPGRAP